MHFELIINELPMSQQLLVTYGALLLYLIVCSPESLTGDVFNLVEQWLDTIISALCGAAPTKDFPEPKSSLYAAATERHRTAYQSDR